MLVKLQILASDIKENNYFNDKVCPITKALERAGLKGYTDSGMAIYTAKGETVRPKGYETLVDTLVPMVHTVMRDNGKILHHSVRFAEPTDFEVELEFP